MSELEPDRAKRLGELIASARARARREVEACAQVAGLTVAEYEEAEAGRRDLSLPQLEILAMFLDVPMAYFWGNAAPPPARDLDYAGYLALRRLIMGAQLRQARLDAGRSLEQVGVAVDLPAEKIAAFEAGREPVPYFTLEATAQYLHVSVRDLSEDRHGPLAQHETRLALRRQTEALPAELKAFLAEPVNLRYLELAHRLSQMEADRLRTIAESILEITL